MYEFEREWKMKAKWVRGLVVVLSLAWTFGAVLAREPLPKSAGTPSLQTAAASMLTAPQGAAFARTTYPQMAAFDRANPHPQQRVIPFMPAPPPRVADADATAAAGGIVPLPADTGGASQHPGRIGVSSGPAPTTAAPPLTGNFAGTIDDGTSIPPDTMGAVGPNHVVELLNTGYQVFNRSGGIVSPQVSLSAFWSVLGTAPGQPASCPFDPHIIFDQYSNRFVVVDAANGGSCDGTGFAWVLVGISDSDDPTLGWSLYAIQANVAPDASNWNDYPGLGVDPNNVVATFNMFSGGGAFRHVDVFVIDKAALLAGPGPLVLGTHYSRFHDPCVEGAFSVQTCHTYDQTPGTAVNYLLSEGWLDGATRTRRFVRINSITGTGAAAVLGCSGGNNWVEVAGYNFNMLGGPQKDCASPIDPLDPRFINAVVRHGRIWTTHGVGAGSGITDSAPPSRTEAAWYQINPAVAGPFPGGVPDQQGKVSSPTVHYFDPSIAVNADDCVALGFTGSSPTTYASAYYTARFPADPPGTMQPVSLLKAGLAPYRKNFGDPRNRWGDYSATMVDPVDDQTFWTLQEYAALPFIPGNGCGVDGGRWGTWWGVFQCGELAKFSQPPDSSGEDIASNLDATDLAPSTVLADDFTSDGRPITTVRWWGSDLSVSPIDGWLISFHEPLSTGGAPVTSLGLYFCDKAVVVRDSTALAACDADPVFVYNAKLANCCLLHAQTDTRTGFTPALPGTFDEESCYKYDMDIQAVVGHTFLSAGGVCTTEVLTGNSAVADFWGWHTTGVENGVRSALQTNVSMSGSDLLYGPWSSPAPICSAPNMAFELLTNVGPPPDCNNNGIPDQCEANDCQPNGVPDDCDITSGFSQDCNGNHTPDECDIALGALDCQPDGILDSCQLAGNDANGNGIPDECDPPPPQTTSGPDRIRFFGLVVALPPTGPAYQVDDGGAETSIGVNNNGGPPGQAFGWANRFTNTTGGPITIVTIDVAFGTPGGGAGVAPGNAVDAVIWIDAAATGNMLNAVKAVRWSLPGGVHAADGTFKTHAVPLGGVVIPTGADFYVGLGDIQTSIDSVVRFPASIDTGPSAVRSWAFFHNTLNVFNPDSFTNQTVGTIDSFGLPGNWLIRAHAGGPASPTALRVNLVDLQNPVPPNAAQFPPQNFGCWEAGAACGTVMPPPPGLPCNATGESVPPTPGPTPPSGQGGCARWVGQPGTFYESQGPPLAGPFRAARLQCTPLYRDWTPDGVFYVTGGEVVPSSKYDVQSFAASCAGMEGSCLDSSPPLHVATARSGDVEAVYQPPTPPLTQPNAIDLAQLVNKFKSLVGAPVKSRAQLQPNLPELNADINALDITAVVDAIKGKAYPFSGPCPCPSTVTCNLTLCTSPAPCGSGMCVKTCTGGGPNDDQPCINNSHCPGGACGSGFCRDACGRCSPP